jgi:hypothetical protein
VHLETNITQISSYEFNRMTQYVNLKLNRIVFEIQPKLFLSKQNYLCLFKRGRIMLRINKILSSIEIKSNDGCSCLPVFLLLKTTCPVDVKICWQTSGIPFELIKGLIEGKRHKVGQGRSSERGSEIQVWRNHKHSGKCTQTKTFL